MSKSYVTLEQQICVVCGQPFDTGTLLLDTRLRNKFEQNTVTGWGMCNEHRKLKEEGYVALVCIDETKSGVFFETTTVDPAQVYRLGKIAHIKSETFNNMFNTDVPDGMVAFVDEELMGKLEEVHADIP